MIQWWVDDWRKALKRGKKFLLFNEKKINVKFAELHLCICWSAVVAVVVAVPLSPSQTKDSFFNVCFQLLSVGRLLIWFSSIFLCFLVIYSNIMERLTISGIEVHAIVTFYESSHQQQARDLEPALSNETSFWDVFPQLASSYCLQAINIMNFCNIFESRSESSQQVPTSLKAAQPKVVWKKLD